MEVNELSEDPVLLIAVSMREPTHMHAIGPTCLALGTRPLKLTSDQGRDTRLMWGFQFFIAELEGEEAEGVTHLSGGLNFMPQN